MKTVAVIDYGAGNASSVLRALEAAGAEAAVLTDRPEQILAADRLILPGVGASAAAMDGLRSRGLVEVLGEAVQKRAMPILGICVGMQIMAEKLHEFGEHRGLGWIGGEVDRLCPLDAAAGVRVPHMGWNIVKPTRPAPLFNRLQRYDFYFAHSFVIRPTNSDVVIATTQHGGELCVAVQKDTALGVQFHPEKSQIGGQRLIGEFLDWKP